MHVLTNPRLRLPILVLVAIAVRALTFGNPVVHVDEEFYFVTAHQMWRGALPFVDVWDRKPVGLFLLYMPAAAWPWPWGIWAYQLTALACVIATAELIGRFATRAGWADGATWAGIAYILWLDPLGGAGGQSPVYYNVPMTAAALLVATARGPRRRWHGLAAMGLVGLSLQIKYSVVFEGMLFGLWLLGQEWRARRSVATLIGVGAMLVLVALLPTLAAFAFYAAHGQAEAFVYANFTSILARRPDPWPEALGNAGGLILMLSPLVAMAFGSRGTATGGDGELRRFLVLWFATCLVGIALFGGWFDHYGLPAVAPGAACAAGFLGAGRWRGRASPVILLLVAVIGQATMIVNRLNRGSASQLDALTAAIGKDPGCLYVYSGTTMLYASTGRCAVTRYLFPSHLGRLREAGATGVDQDSELRRILAARPGTVVMRPPYTGERPAAHALVAAAMARDYRLTARLPMGNEAISVYQLRR